MSARRVHRWTDANDKVVNGAAVKNNHLDEAHQTTLGQHTLNILVKDAIVQLVSRTIGMTLKCDKTTSLSINGREEDESSFKVHNTGQRGVICLENITHEHHFVYSDEDSFTAHQGEVDDVRNKLVVGETDDGFLQFQSFVHPGSYLTVSTKTRELLLIADSKDSRNHDTHFILRPKYLPGMISSLPSPARNLDARMVTPHVAVAFADGNCICLRSKTSGRCLSVSTTGNVITGVGSESEESSRFYVRTTNEGSLLLQTATDSRKYLSISDDCLNCQGGGGRGCNFYLYDHHEGLISLESVVSSGHHVGIAENGRTTEPSKTRNSSPEGQFYFTIIQLANSRNLFRSSKKKTNTRSLYAGPSIMSKFRGNSLIQLISMITNQPIWVFDGTVAASTQGFLGVSTIKLSGLPVVPKNDTRRLIDQFYVQVRRPGVVALQSAKNTACFLSIKKGAISANGNGDAYCNFAITEDDNGFVSLESELYLDQFLGFTATGVVMPPTSVHPDSVCGKFLVRVMNLTGTPYPIPSVAANVDSSQVSPIVQVAFQDLAKIHIRPRSLMSADHDSNLRVMDDASINCAGRDGDPYATFIVHTHSEIPGVISLQNAMNTFNWLAIREGKLIGDGEPTDESLFKLMDKGGGIVSFESMADSTKFRHCYIAVKSNGTAGNTRSTGFLCDEVLFQVRIAQLPKFYDGAKVILFSKEFKKAIRLMPNGDVNCLGGHGMKAQFFVHGRRSGVVALQNAMFPDKWLCIHDGKVTVGPGDNESEFRFHEKDSFVSFESVAYPGHYLGVQSNGHLKTPVKGSSPDDYDLFDIKNAER